MKLHQINFAAVEAIRFFAVYVSFAVISLSAPEIVSAQIKEKVEIVPRIIVDDAGKNCKDLQLGKAIFYLVPDYPIEAKTNKIGGTVEVSVKVDETGKVSEIGKVTGNRFLQGAASEAANKIKFSRTICAKTPIAVSAVIAYNFAPAISVRNYFSPTKIAEFSDVNRNLQTYEAIQSLTEKYKIAFGYEDKNFYAEAPLTRGDFAHFLRLTLDLLTERAKTANKIPRQINLFYSLNPNKLTSTDKIKDLDKKYPFYDSFRILLLKYDISLANEKNEFGGFVPLTQNQLLDLWTKIFGGEAVPVNFEFGRDTDRIITRGDFALFLQESFEVLTYKVLP